MNEYSFSRSEFINGEEFRFSYFTFAGRSGTIGLALDRPPLPPAPEVGHPVGLILQTNGETQWEYDLDAVSNDLVIAYTPGLGDVLRMEQQHAQMVLGPGIASASEELGQFTIHTNRTYGIDIRSKVSVPPDHTQLPEVGYHFSALDQQRDGVRLGKDATVGRNWLHFHQGSGVYDWRIGMDAEYSLTFRTGKGQDTSAEKPGNIALELTAQGEVKLPELAYSVAGTPLVLDSNGCVRKQAPTDHEARIKHLEDTIAELVRKVG